MRGVAPGPRWAHRASCAAFFSSTSLVSNRPQTSSTLEKSSAPHKLSPVRDEQRGAALVLPQQERVRLFCCGGVEDACYNCEAHRRPRDVRKKSETTWPKLCKFYGALATRWFLPSLAMQEDARSRLRRTSSPEAQIAQDC